MFTLRVDNEIELRLHDESFVEEFHQLIDRNRKFLDRYVEWGTYHQRPEDTRQYIHAARKEFAEQVSFATVIHYRGKVAGSIELRVDDWSWGHAEIGYWLGEEFTGKGIVTRAAKALLDYAFNTLGLHKVIIRAIKENTPSWKVAERLSMTHEGYQIQQRLLYGKYYDYTVYYQLAADWESKATPDFAHRLDEKLELRPILPYHAAAYFALIDRNRAFIGQWMDWVAATKTVDDIHAFVQRNLAGYGESSALRMGIYYEGKVAGQVGYNYLDLRFKKAEIGYWLGEEFSGKGLMTKSVAAIVDYGIKIIGLHRIEILMAEGNLASEAIPKRLGFMYEGTIRSGELVNGKFLNDKLYAMLSQDWKRP